MSGATPVDMEDSKDSAWVSVAAGLSEAELLVMCRDIERLFRINPYLEFHEWMEKAPGRYRMRVRNLANARDFDLDLSAEALDDGVLVRYRDGLKRLTSFRVEASGGDAVLVVKDVYADLPEAEKEARHDEVDNSLVPWGNALWRYFRLWRRWSWFAPWRWYMTRIWQPMKPSGRRIASLIILITVAEFVGFLFVFLLFWLNLDRYF